ncbi:uridine kinase [Caulobacter mirabilis]|uniref:Uridine kinase n=1 Tax=Caulobacter mirabilis TaxID=69666 RepID=A0A2D2AVD9_9CAUL|nr:uridine kinase [Caulobacter mirabilis]ATQ41927.1 uridine kinase [Caulobacter mirabilis]
MTKRLSDASQRPLLIAVSGGSGSGKSTLAHALQARLPEGCVRLIIEDDYYRDFWDEPGFDPASFDFDDVAAKDHALLATHLAALREGETVQAPVYCFETHRRKGEPAAVAPAPVVVVEGAHLLCTPALADLFDLRIFVDTPADVRFIRRLIRDQIQRGRTAQSVIDQYLATVRPAHERLIEPSRGRADLIIADARGAVIPDDPTEFDRLLAPVLGHPLLKTLTL